MSDEEPVHKKYKCVPIKKKRFQYHWFDVNPSWKTWVNFIPNEPNKFYCKACNKLLACGLTEIKRHSVKISHVLKMKELYLNSNISKVIISNETSIETVNCNEPEMTQSLPDLKEDVDFKERVLKSPR